MDKESWRKRITESCRKAGTYREYFDDVIDTLAETLESRDKAREDFYTTGKGQTIVKHTNKGGNTNIVKNPMLVIVDDLNKTALTYWRDLGLTPAGLRRINEEAMKGNPEKPNLGAILKEMDI